MCAGVEGLPRRTKRLRGEGFGRYMRAVAAIMRCHNVVNFKHKVATKSPDFPILCALRNSRCCYNENLLECMTGYNNFCVGNS